jgi:hypothetical protein
MLTTARFKSWRTCWTRPHFECWSWNIQCTVKMATIEETLDLKLSIFILEVQNSFVSLYSSSLCYPQLLRANSGHSSKKLTIAFFQIKVKLSLPTPWKRTGAVDTQLYLFLTSALDRGEWLILGHGKELPVLIWGWVGPRAGLDVLETTLSILPLPEFEPRTVQPVA